MNQTARVAIFAFLDEHDIAYKQHEHEPVFTCEEAERVTGHIPGIDAKTLLVSGKKSGSFYLVSLPAEKRIDQKQMRGAVGENVSFAGPEDLERMLRTLPGSVSPLGLIFDANSEIQKYLIDSDITDAAIVTWHPNDNSQTLEFSQGEFQKFLELIPHQTTKI